MTLSFCSYRFYTDAKLGCSGAWVGRVSLTFAAPQSSTLPWTVQGRPWRLRYRGGATRTWVKPRLTSHVPSRPPTANRVKLAPVENRGQCRCLRCQGILSRALCVPNRESFAAAYVVRLSSRLSGFFPTIITYLSYSSQPTALARKLSSAAVLGRLKRVCAAR
jgi:hypothetical protein